MKETENLSLPFCGASKAISFQQFLGELLSARLIPAYPIALFHGPLVNALSRLLIGLVCSFGVLLHAQGTDGNPGKFQFTCGMMVVTCFSGAESTLQSASCGNGDVSYPNAYVLGIIDVTSPPGPSFFGTNWPAPMFHNSSGATPFIQKNLGEIFGVTLDNQNPPNIYVAATSIYRPNNVPAGSAFGPAGPGGVYRIDGTTFNITTLTTIPTAGDVSLGNLCFSPAHNQIYVADLETGLIHRVSMSGSILGNYDHGVVGRPNDSLIAIPDNGVPGLTQNGRRVFAVQVYQGRLYYSVWDGKTDEVWSVGLTPTGVPIPSGAQGPRREFFYITLPSGWGGDAPITDIAFSKGGKMLVAERNLCDQDPINLSTAAHHARLLEYQLIGNTWTFAVNHPVGPTTSSTNSEGGTDWNCDDWYAVTGELPPTISNLIYGVQLSLPSSTSSADSYNIDLDGNTQNYDKTSLGDVQFFRCCDCLTLSNENFQCLATNQFTWNFCATNTGTLTNGHFVFIDLPPGVTVSPQIIDLNPPLLPGQGVCTNVTFTFPVGFNTNNLCFRLAAHTPDYAECCVLTRCLPVPECCGILTGEKVVCDPTTPAVSWNFNLQNQSGSPVQYVIVVPEPAGCASVVNPVIFLNPPLQVGQTTNISVALSITNSPCQTACFRVSLHDPKFRECCSFLRCVELSCKLGNHPPNLDCAQYFAICDVEKAVNYVIGIGVQDPDGDPLTVIWKVNGSPVLTNNVAGGVSAGGVGLQLTHSYPAGMHIVTVCVSDGNGAPVVCNIRVEVGDLTPPQLKCPPDFTIDKFSYVVPNFLTQIMVTDNCSTTAQIKLTQEPPAGTVLGAGHHCIKITAMDAAGNSVSCLVCIDVLPIQLFVGNSIPIVGNTVASTAPADLTLSILGNLTDTRRVEYFVDGKSIGTGGGNGFKLDWRKVAQGTYQVVAQAEGPGTSTARDTAIVVIVAAPGTAAVRELPAFHRVVLSRGQLVVTLPTVAGERCFLETADSLVSPDWRVVSEMIGDGEEHQLKVNIDGDVRFLRVRVE